MSFFYIFVYIIYNFFYYIELFCVPVCMIVSFLVSNKSTKVRFLGLYTYSVI